MAFGKKKGESSQEAHDRRTAEIRAAQQASEAPLLTAQELEKLQADYPKSISGITRRGGKFEVHFHRGKRPPGY